MIEERPPLFESFLCFSSFLKIIPFMRSPSKLSLRESLGRRVSALKPRFVGQEDRL